ncbi:hypothetical protein BV898_03687 [Hypsibius exemplaris]|uniref:Uncharacterized protein n=1 Tax=Hypsibius exemplaris TaxID=2072580 RepID=A0A1W0X4X4_HYPEX|nr:hypothetical protein BV898_03687 [Hypsibius exemplaris]
MARMFGESRRSSLKSPAAVVGKRARSRRPTIPEKIDEIMSLTKTHDELEHGRRNLDEIFERLEKEQRAVDRNIAVLTEKTAELRTALKGLPRRRLLMWMKPSFPLRRFKTHTSELSRKQFMQRALVQKCRDKAGLP